MHPLTIIVTSCDRFDLLERTLDSFFALNKYPYVAFHIHNDSLNLPPIELVQKYSDKNITWHSGTKRGLSASWDYLVGLVETEYFLSIEDDFLFSNNANFISESICLLELCIANQVWIRFKSDHSHPIDDEIISTNGIEYNKVLTWGDWCGFSFNPAVRKKSKWLELFPNGIAGKDEKELSIIVKDNYIVVSLCQSSIVHIGGGKRSKKFKI